MAMNSYQYGTSPRKYEPDYRNRRAKQPTQHRVPKKQVERKKITNNKKQTKQDVKHKFKMLVMVVAIFGMLLTVSYREILLMEMFNQKKELENKMALIDKENGQIEKNLKELESTLDWNKIKKVATEELGMTTKAGTPIDLEKKDFIEKEEKLIKEEKKSFIEKIYSYFINK